MRHPYFHKAVAGAFERLVPQGMMVPYYIYFKVPPTDIDVNIHPTKTEIKFENEQGIWQILSAAVKDAIGRFCEVPAIDFDTEGKPDIPVFDTRLQAVEMPKVAYNPDYNPFKSATSSNNTSTNIYNNVKELRHRSSVSDLSGAEWQQLYEDTLFQEVKPSEQQAPAHLLVDKSSAHYQYKGRYIMTAVRSGLMIIDQHRADVRICYERFLEQFHQHQNNIQRLLFPEIVQFPLSEATVLDQIMPELTSLGFDMSPLGGGSYAVGGVPAGLEGLDPSTLIRDVVTEACEHQGKALEQIHSAMALSLARHAAIPQGQVLSNEEMENIVSQLFACSNVNYTPDGHVIMSILSQDYIEQLFDEKA